MYVYIRSRNYKPYIFLSFLFLGYVIVFMQNAGKRSKSTGRDHDVNRMQSTNREITDESTIDSRTHTEETNNGTRAYETSSDLMNAKLGAATESFLLNPEFDITSDEVNEDEREGTTRSRTMKKILLWNSHFRNFDYNFGLGHSPFIKHGCEETRCTITRDRKSFAEADAVVFHAWQINATDIPERAFRQQIFVFYMFESPLKTNMHIQGMNDIFNLTYTYLNDSLTDIFTPLGRVVERPSSVLPYVVPSEEFLGNKTKPVVWAVSNCSPKGQRVNYIEELKKYLPVDVYGSCGKLKCPKKQFYKCYRMFEVNYMFLIAFENSYCKDYITEKMFVSMKYDIVPIALGYGDYKSIFPDKSHLHVSDFESPKELAKYVLSLKENLVEYQKYFYWKTKWRVESAIETRPLGFCKLCKILHDPNYEYKHNFDVVRYWDPGRLCKSGEEEREAIHLWTDGK